MMANELETSGANVDEAVDRALSQLGLNRDQVDVDVVREGKKGGFLGIGAESAVVRVTEKARAGSSDGDGEPSSDGDDGDDGERSSEGGGGRRQRGGRGRGGRRRGGRGRGNRGDSGDSGDSGDGGSADNSTGESDNDGRRDEPRREQRERRPRRESAPYTAAEEPMLVPGAPDELPSAPPTDAEDEMDFAGHTLRDLLNFFGLEETEISGREPETAGDGVGLITQVFDIYGETNDASDELGLLIGRRGETLQALQYLLNVMVSTRYDGDHVFAVDVEGYRRRRETTLQDLAERVATEVIDTGDVITLEPMPAAERRIIHLTLEAMDGVTTESVGSGNNRQVEVLPGE
jgi:spoIIIJ-associated protein